MNGRHVARAEDLQRLVDLAVQPIGRIDAVFNGTGHPPKGPLLQISDGNWHLRVDMVLLNVIRMARLVTITGQNLRVDGGITRSV